MLWLYHLITQDGPAVPDLSLSLPNAWWRWPVSTEASLHLHSQCSYGQHSRPCWCQHHRGQCWLLGPCFDRLILCLREDLIVFSRGRYKLSKSAELGSDSGWKSKVGFSFNPYSNFLLLSPHRECRCSMSDSSLGHTSCEAPALGNAVVLAGTPHRL